MPNVKSNYPRAVVKKGKTAVQLSGLVDAYLSFFWTTLPFLALLIALFAVSTIGELGAEVEIVGLVIANYCIALPLLFFQLGTRSPVNRTLAGMIASDRLRALSWLLIFFATTVGLGLLIPFALHIATFLTLHRHGIRIHPLGFNRRQIYAQIGSLGAREIFEESR